MVDSVKETLETGGFSQQVVGITRSWPGQNYSLLDHCWINTPENFFSCTNTVRAAGNHNLIQVRLRLKGSDSKRLDARHCNYKDFYPVVYREMLSNVNWEELYAITSPELGLQFSRDYHP